MGHFPAWTENAGPWQEFYHIRKLQLGIGLLSLTRTSNPTPEARVRSEREREEAGEAVPKSADLT